MDIIANRALYCAGFFVAASLLVLGVGQAQATQSELLEAYQRADRMQALDHYKVFQNQLLLPHWVSDVEFWYSRKSDGGSEWVVVNAAKGTKRAVFDRHKLAAALTQARGKPVDAKNLPLRGLEISLQPVNLRFHAFGTQWDYSPSKNRLTQHESASDTWRVAPNGKLAVFSRDDNLWLVDTRTKKEIPLTTDGESLYAYGAVPSATGRSVQKPEVVWSPDSKRLLAIQTDDRQVKELPMIDSAPEKGGLRAKAQSNRTAFPGDPSVTTFRILSIDVGTGEQVAAKHRPVPAVRMNDTPTGGGRAWWNEDSHRAYFVDIDRGERLARVIEFNTDTGATRTVFEEAVNTYFECGENAYVPCAITPLPATDEVLWYSERSGWAHLYLYNLDTGKLVHPVTSGDWRVRDVLGADEGRREVYVTISGKKSGKDPYYHSVAKIGIDDGRVTLLSSDDADHIVEYPGGFHIFMAAFEEGADPTSINGLSPGRDYFVETTGTLATLPRTVLRRTTDGSLVMELEQATAPGLPKTGWYWPERVQLTAADGKTVISGAVFRPTGFSTDKKYPVIDFIYGGPQVANVPTIVDSGNYGMAQAMADLGFVVVMIDGRGTTGRSRAFHETSYGNLQNASNLEDHIAGLRELAKRYPYLDLDRVGIYGFSGGGYMTAQAMMRFPKFFTVGVAGSGNYDQRLFWNTWGERYQGMLKGDNYVAQATTTYAGNLEGKLLFLHGLRDYGVHPSALWQLIQALEDHNKPYDLVIEPRAGHELTGYAMVRMWNYFVQNLAGLTPPVGFSAKSSSDYSREKAKAIADEKKAATVAASHKNH